MVSEVSIQNVRCRGPGWVLGGFYTLVLPLRVRVSNRHPQKRSRRKTRRAGSLKEGVEYQEKNGPQVSCSREFKELKEQRKHPQDLATEIGNLSKGSFTGVLKAGSGLGLVKGYMRSEEIESVVIGNFKKHC